MIVVGVGPSPKEDEAKLPQTAKISKPIHRIMGIHSLTRNSGSMIRRLESGPHMEEDKARNLKRCRTLSQEVMELVAQTRRRLLMPILVCGAIHQ